MFPYIRPQDIADILIMTFLVYQLYSWFKNTKAWQVVIGLGFLVVLYVITKNLGLFMTSWILQELGTVLFILLIVIFQTEIRQALYRFSLLRNLFDRRESQGTLDLQELATAVFSLAASRTGAIVVVQRQEELDEYLLHGVRLDSIVSAQLIGTIFRDGTPLHDGALVINRGRITQASCHLPLSSNADLPQHLGTRHRAALGLSERSDAAVVVVSEERGAVSLAVAGRIVPVARAEDLQKLLGELVALPSPEVVQVSLRKKLFSNLGSKLTILCLVIGSWLIITARQGGIVTVMAPLKYHNLPEGLALTRTTPEEVEVQMKVFSRMFASPKQIDVVADMDLAAVKEGTNQLAITAADLQLPLGGVVTGITPSVVKVVAEKKVKKTLRVRVKSPGRLGRGKRVVVQPAAIIAEGPEHVMNQLDSVETENIDLAEVRRGTAVKKRLLQPAPQVRILADDEVTVTLAPSR